MYQDLNVQCILLVCNPCNVINLHQIDELSRTDPKFREGLEVQ